MPREQIEHLAEIYLRSKALISTWGMGLTQHRHSVATVHALSNLMMLRGHVGRPGAGLLPVRGHSNVQGNRSMGIENRPTAAFIDRMAHSFAGRCRASRGWTWWRPSPRCATAACNCCSRWAAISRWRRRTRKRPGPRCAIAR